MSVMVLREAGAKPRLKHAKEYLEETFVMEGKEQE